MAAASRIRLDLNSPEFQDVFFRLTAADLKQVAASLARLRELDWNALYHHTGYQWELIGHVKGPGGVRVYSLRLSQKIRAVGYRDGDLLRLVSLHPDHDSPDTSRRPAPSMHAAALEVRVARKTTRKPAAKRPAAKKQTAARKAASRKTAAATRRTSATRKKAVAREAAGKTGRTSTARKAGAGKASSRTTTARRKTAARGAATRQRRSRPAPTTPSVMERVVAAVRGTIAGAAAAVPVVLSRSDSSPDAIQILEEEHRRFEDLLRQGDETTERARKGRRHAFGSHRGTASPGDSPTRARAADGDSFTSQKSYRRFICMQRPAAPSHAASEPL